FCPRSLLKKSLGIKGRHASCPRSRYSLAIDVVLNITRRKYAWQTGASTIVRNDITIGVSLDLPVENLGVRIMANGNKNTIAFEVGHFVVADISKLYAPNIFSLNVIDVIN